MSEYSKSEYKNSFIIKIVYRIINFIYKVYFYTKQKKYVNRHHLEISLEKGFNLRIGWYTHYQYLVYKYEVLKEARKKVRGKEYIEFALNNCKQCNSISFYISNNKPYIEYWVGGKGLIAEWTISKKNIFREYTYAMLGVLNEIGIHEVKEGNIKPKRLSYYTRQADDEVVVYQIHFQKYPEEAVIFTSTMFEKVFKQQMSKIKVEIR